MALIVVLAITVLLTTIGVTLVGLMHTDITHASIQHALAQSFYNAQAGVADATAQVFASANPVGYTNPHGGSGEVLPYGQNGSYTYWVDTGPAAGTPCGAGFKTIEAVGQTTYLGRSITSRVRACGVPGVPFLTALFGVSRVEAQGPASRTYLPPYLPGTPGAPRGGNVGSFTELNFDDIGIRMNALSETTVDTVSLRDGTFHDYELYGFSSRPSYEIDPNVNPTPWILQVFGDFVKAQPTTGPIMNDCGTPYACLTVQNSNQDVTSIAALRDTDGVRHAYMSSMNQQMLPALSLTPSVFESRALSNSANSTLNERAGLTVTNSSYTPAQFDQLINYMAGCRSCALRGTVYVDGTYRLTQSINLGGIAGDVTLAVRGDLVLDPNVHLKVLHDLSTPSGRQTPGILVFGLAVPDSRLSDVCSGEQANGSGQLIMCGGSSQLLIVDGLIYTVDGMSIGPGATVDQIGAMYHGNRATGNPSFTNQAATVVLRFDPLSLAAFGRGITIVSWQQCSPSACD